MTNRPFLSRLSWRSVLGLGFLLVASGIGLAEVAPAGVTQPKDPVIEAQGSSGAALSALESSIRSVENDLKTERERLSTSLAPDERAHV